MAFTIFLAHLVTRELTRVAWIAPCWYCCQDSGSGTTRRHSSTALPSLATTPAPMLSRHWTGVLRAGLSDEPVARLGLRDRVGRHSSNCRTPKPSAVVSGGLDPDRMDGNRRLETARDWTATAQLSVEDRRSRKSLDRLVLSLLMAAALAVSLKRSVHWGALLKNNRWLVVLIVYMGVSITWSAFPAISLKRWFRTLGPCELSRTQRTGYVWKLSKRCSEERPTC